MKSPLLCLLLLLPALALADSSPVYKWTDAAGVIHYSDKPSADAAVDVHPLDLPPLPPQDPAAIAAQQSALLAQLAAIQKLQQSDDIQRQQAAELARKQAELEATLAALQEAQSEREAAPLVYTSAFVPVAYRRNLYVHHRRRDDGGHPHPLPPGKPALPSNPHP